MSTEREEMLEEANALGLEFPSNIPGPKLKALIAEAKGEPAPVEEEAPKSPAAKPEAPKEPTVDEDKPAKVADMSVFARRRQKIAEAKRKAMKTSVVTITNKDNRENDVMTTAYLSFENQHFGLSKLVPLDVPVELEAALINIAETTMMTLHKDEIVDGKRTGNKVTVRTKKYAVSYGRNQE